MKILAFDTSGPVASVAVTDGETVLGEYSLNHGKTHSQVIIHMADELLKRLDIGAGDIDLFAAAIGPGSFTGLRIGVTSVKAMAYATEKPVIGVPTLDALAFGNIQSIGLMACPMIDAKNGTVYSALYKMNDDTLERIIDYSWISVEEMLAKISNFEESTIFTGDGAIVHHELIKSKLGLKAVFARPNQMLQRASSVALLALDEYNAGKRGKVEDMVPFYIRKSQPEREDKK